MEPKPTRDGTDGGDPASRDLDRDEMGVPEEEFDALLDAMPAMNQLSERLTRLRGRVQDGLDRGGLPLATKQEVEAELEEIQEDIERLGI